MKKLIRKTLLISNILLICLEIIIIALIKFNIISSNYGLEVRFNLFTYLSILGFQTMTIYLASNTKKDINQSNLLMAQLIIYPFVFAFILNELNVI